MTVPVYNARSLRLIVNRDCLSRAVTHVRSHSYLDAFCFNITTIRLRCYTLVVNIDDGSNLIIESDCVITCLRQICELTGSF